MFGIDGRLKPVYESVLTQTYKNGRIISLPEGIDPEAKVYKMDGTVVRDGDIALLDICDIVNGKISFDPDKAKIIGFPEKVKNITPELAGVR